MPTVYKVLAQSSPVGLVLTDIYTVPAATSTVVSSITVANRGPDLAVFRVAISPTGAAIANQHYLYYDVVIGGNDTFIATVGLTLATTDVVRVRAGGLGGDDLTFQLYGSELT